jgi:hypothetical protein
LDSRHQTTGIGYDDGSSIAVALLFADQKGFTAICGIVSVIKGVGPLKDLLMRDAMQRTTVEMDEERLFQKLYAFEVIENRKVNRADPTRRAATKAPSRQDAPQKMKLPSHIIARG